MASPAARAGSHRVSLIEKGPRIIVYKVCCIGPIDGVPPFASDFGQRYCPQYLPLSDGTAPD